MEPAENFYELLEVESTASFEEVQQAYEKKLEEVLMILVNIMRIISI